MQPPTDRQVVILRVIRDLSAERGFPPTLQELSARLNLSAKGGAASQVKALSAKGLLTVFPRTSRSMLVTEEGLKWIEALAEQERAAQTDSVGEANASPGL